jgi:hypothetical protein
MKHWVAQITEAQANELNGREWQPSSLFEPFQIGENWYISEAEVFGCTDPELVWVRRLAVVEIEIPVDELPI